MRFPKEFWVWLVETQLEEIKEHTDEHKIAKEFADIIGISVQAIQELMGEEAVKVIIQHRIGRNIDKIPEIAYKYRNKWIEYEAHQQETVNEERRKLDDREK